MMGRATRPRLALKSTGPVQVAAPRAPAAPVITTTTSLPTWHRFKNLNQIKNATFLFQSTPNAFGESFHVRYITYCDTRYYSVADLGEGLGITQGNRATTCTIPKIKPYAFRARLQTGVASFMWQAVLTAQGVKAFIATRPERKMASADSLRRFADWVTMVVDSEDSPTPVQGTPELEASDPIEMTPPPRPTFAPAAAPFTPLPPPPPAQNIGTASVLDPVTNEFVTKSFDLEQVRSLDPTHPILTSGTSGCVGAPDDYIQALTALLDYECPNACPGFKKSLELVKQAVEAAAPPLPPDTRFF